MTVYVNGPTDKGRRAKATLVLAVCCFRLRLRETPVDGLTGQASASGTPRRAECR